MPAHVKDMQAPRGGSEIFGLQAVARRTNVRRTGGVKSQRVRGSGARLVTLRTSKRGPRRACSSNLKIAVCVYNFEGTRDGLRSYFHVMLIDGASDDPLVIIILHDLIPGPLTQEAGCPASRRACLPGHIGRLACGPRLPRADVPLARPLELAGSAWHRGFPRGTSEAARR